jgi:hypothetical protein
MDDIARQDRKLFFQECLRFGRVFISAAALLLVTVPLRTPIIEGLGFGMWLAAIATIGIAHGLSSYNASIKRRFINKRFEALWNGISDRLRMFDEVLSRMRKDSVADLQELPKNIRRVSHALYGALRRSDLISHEVALTEKGLYVQAPNWQAPSHDAQAKELYRIADKNIAEYRSHFAGVMAGVQRTEAQAAVYMTTVDTLRMKMIGYRLVGRGPELSSQDFIEAMQEAKMQLAAIDQALDELELMPFPKTIAAIPPPTPEDAMNPERLGQEKNA